MSKIIALTLAAITATASIASAENSFQSSEIKHERDNRIEVGLVRADTDGVVEIYAYHQHELGILLGSTDVHAGANPDVFINISRPTTEAVAVLKVNGDIVAMEEIHFR